MAVKIYGHVSGIAVSCKHVAPVKPTSLTTCSGIQSQLFRTAVGSVKRQSCASSWTLGRKIANVWHDLIGCQVSLKRRTMLTTKATSAAEQPVEDIQGHVAIVLVEPKRGENIGAAARAMKNFGLSDLRLVAPVDGWPNERARAMAARAVDVVDSAKVFPSLTEAIADLECVFATSGRPRAPLVQREYLGTRTLVEKFPYNARSGVMFGRENNGLLNTEIALADKIITIDSDPDFYSLNLGQAVVIVCYELFGKGRRPPRRPKPRLVRQEELEAFTQELFGELEAKEFWTDSNRDFLQAGLRSLLSRIDVLSTRDLGFLRGVVKALKKDKNAGESSKQQQ